MNKTRREFRVVRLGYRGKVLRRKETRQADKRSEEADGTSGLYMSSHHDFMNSVPPSPRLLYPVSSPFSPTKGRFLKHFLLVLTAHPPLSGAPVPPQTPSSWPDAPSCSIWSREAREEEEHRHSGLPLASSLSVKHTRGDVNIGNRANEHASERRLQLVPVTGMSKKGRQRPAGKASQKLSNMVEVATKVRKME